MSDVVTVNNTINVLLNICLFSNSEQSSFSDKIQIKSLA